MTNTMPAAASTNDLQLNAAATTDIPIKVTIDWNNLYLSPGELKKEDEKHGNKLRIKTNRKLLFTKKGKYK